MEQKEYDGNIEVTCPRELDLPKEIITIQKIRPQPQKANLKLIRKHRFLFVGIVSSLFVLIASVAWVSIRLVRNNIREGGRYKNSNNNSIVWVRDQEDDNDALYDDIDWYDAIDWHSTPDQGYNDVEDQYFDDTMIIDEAMIERDDILMDDMFAGDYTISYNNKNMDEESEERDINLNLFLCPPPDKPLTISLAEFTSYNSVGSEYHRVLLANSAQGVLCTLVEVTADPEFRANRDLQIKPIGRSYNGGGWEPYYGLNSPVNIVPLSCSDPNSKDCLIALPPLAPGKQYILKSYKYSLGPRDQAARFLERTTFGATNAEIDTFVASGSDPSGWLRWQLGLPITSHRQYFRERANNFHAETTAMGALGFGPCQTGARYRRFVFVAKDIGRYMTISPSPINKNYKVLSVGGQFRSILTGRVKYFVSDINKPVAPDGSYEICSIANTPSIGNHVSIRINSECHDAIFDGVFGNPVVKLDEQHLGLAERIVTLEGNAVPVMEDFFVNGTQMRQLIWDINDEGCSDGITGAPEVVTIASIGNTFWIHTPFFQLQDNRITAPLLDGGKSALEATANAPEDRMKVQCSNVPRNFLNEDHCILSNNACSSKDEASTLGATVICGSSYEVASIPDPNAGTLGRGSFDILTQFNKTMPNKRLEGQRETVWLEIALKAKDQLRQRMAWALSQILVVSPNSIQLITQTESFLNYYDIFVRNAFGNYFDILKEVTYSPMMAEMLTYHNGVSTGHAWTKLNKLHHADENYARELLQLFSLGLYRLNDDGTIQTNTNGHEIRTYKNHEVSEYAKVFVGLKKQPRRGNIEDVSFTQEPRNEIDPLRIIAEHKDHFPKLGMDNRYIGDGYPLCEDLPDRNFLKKGATFRLLGSTPNPDLLNDPEEWWGSDPIRLSLEKSSILGSKLCNKGQDDYCAPMMKVVLENDIDCYGVECTVQELRTFEIGEGSDIWYEYVRPPCVNHAFYDGGQSIRRRQGKTGHAMCGNPETLSASTVCCDGADTNSNTQIREETFSGERVSLSFAQNRCSSLTTTSALCKNPRPNVRDCEENGGCDNLGTFYWSSSGCSMAAKINREGKVAVIHNPQIEAVDAYKMVANDTKMFFRVDWLPEDSESLISDLLDDCASFGCTIGDEKTCICPTSIHQALAFANDSDLISVDNVLSLATIGSFRHAEEHFHPINGVEGLSKYPHGHLTTDTVFKIVDSNGQIQFRKNTKNEVHIGTSAAKFRNPVTFYSLSQPTIRDSAYEIDAALQHAFFHKNMAPFIAIRLAQRFGDSNPSPRYVKSISTAFRRGTFIHSTTGKRIGSGRYGCLEATLAAVLLDKEVVDPILDADPAHGSIQEPYLKLVKVLRSLEFQAAKNHPLLTVGSDLQEMIGQQSHKLPNVFSFFKPEYQPAGRVRSAGMSSPESQVLSGRTSVQMMNTIMNYLKYGATSCFGGFGMVQPRQTCRIGDTAGNGGNSSYDPGLVTATDIVDDLATLLTSGRLDDKKRQVIRDAYEDTIARGKSSKEAIINAQQLVVASPEFHTTSLGNTIGQPRPPPVLPEPTNLPYKAVIFVMLPGGYDSYNVLVPKTCSATNGEGKTVREQYLEQRGSVAFDEGAGEFDLSINVTDLNQPCSQFAIHDELKTVKELYDDDDLAFVANAGVINNQGMTKHNFHGLTRSQLFAHNTMQNEVGKVDPYDKKVGTGILGRIKHVLSKKGHVTNTISIDHASIASKGTHGEFPPARIVGRKGAQKFAARPGREFGFDVEKHVRILNSKVDEFSGIFGETWSSQLITGIDDAEEYQSIFDRVELDNSTWIQNGEPDYVGKGKFEREHWEKWSTISKLIQGKDYRNVDRDLFFTELGTWDHHNEMKGGLRSQLRALNYGLKMFVEQAKSSGFWNDVAVVIASDFGRTFTPNSNDGTDHGWGGHYMIMGGNVRGGRILGEYPSDVTPTGHLVDDRGRFLPTTSWDSIWNGIAEWTGVTDKSDLDYCLPNRFRTVDPVIGSTKSFPLLTASSIFEIDEKADTTSRGLRGKT